MYQHIVEHIKDEFDSTYIKPMSEGVTYYAIGDIHGCFNEFKQLIEKIKESHEAKDTKAHFILLGDLIDRGPKSMETVMFIFDHKEDFTVIRGNHEHNFLLELDGKYCRSQERKITHKDFADLNVKQKDKVLSVFHNSKYILFLKGDNGTFVFTHAPVTDFGYTKFTGPFTLFPYLAGKITNRALCMGGGSMNIEMFNDLNSNITKPMTFFHGHQSWSCKPIDEQIEEQKKYKHRIYNLDTGCVYGDTLTACDVKNNVFIHIDSKFSVK